MSAAIGGCGSAYGYSYVAFGEIFAFIIGWDLLLEYSVAVAAVANGWSGYLNKPSPRWHASAGGAHQSAKLGGIINLPAPYHIDIDGLTHHRRKTKRQSQHRDGVVKLITITVFIGIAVFNVDPENWHPFMPFGWFQTLPDGKTTGVLAGASMVFFAYVGFDAVSTAAEEAKDPQRDLPFGIVASLVFCTVIYILVSGLLTGIVPYTQLNVSSPVAHALKLLGIQLGFRPDLHRRHRRINHGHAGAVLRPNPHYLRHVA